MAMKTATPELYARIRKASSTIAAGVRFKKPLVEARGRAAFAEAHIENEVRLYSQHLTQEARALLARLLFEAQTATATTIGNADEDATADAEETSEELSAEVLQIRSVRAPIDMVPTNEFPREALAYDPDNEFEEEEEDYVD